MSRHNRDRRIRNGLARASAGSPAGRPSFVDQQPLSLREMPPTPWHQSVYINNSNTYLRLYSLGECSVIVTREFGKWHLSVAHPRRDPTWAEIAEARYRLLPADVTAALILPPMKDYINIHKFCFQILEIHDPSLAGPGGAVGEPAAMQGADS